jgi:hypothetical protein
VKTIVGVPVVAILLVVGLATVAGANDNGLAASLPAPYAQVSWTHLDYPGLQCQSGVVLERVAEVHLTGLTKPVAVAEVSCDLNHLYANLYVFAATSNPTNPRLIQRLTPATNTGVGQDMALTITANHVELLAASGFHGLCCPTTATTYRWSWGGHTFVESHPVPILSAVMPNLVGSTLTRASNLTERAGIPSAFSVNSADLRNDSSVKIKTQLPKPGVRLRSPFPDFIQVT